MIIQHNLLEMNAYRNTNINNRKRNASAEKLSSGYRINRAADDAAGLSISEKMRAQIRGLEQASQNLQDGLSMVQTAEGGMQEIHSMLQRVRELSVQAANDTNELADRSAIQEEIDQLVDSMDDIANNTEFNRIKVLKGDAISEKTEKIHNSMPSWIVMPTQLDLGSLTVSGVTENYSYATIDFFGVDAFNINDFLDQGFHSTCCTCTEKYSIRFLNTDEPSIGSPNPVININITGVTTGEELVDKILGEGAPFMTHFTQFMKDPDHGDRLILYDNRPGQLSDVSGGYGVLDEGYIETQVIEKGIGYVNIQAGANQGQSIGMRLPNIGADTLGIQGILVLNHVSASYSISVVDRAIDKISEERRIYNRMEHAVSNVDNTSENLMASESRIRDLNIASEMVEFSKRNILQQAGESIMAGSIQSAERVLQLLR